MTRFFLSIIIFLASTQASATPATSLWATDDLGQSYFSFPIDQDLLQGAPNRTDLNTALTPADKLFVRDGHFFRVGNDLKANTTDDTRVRLYGINLSFATNFPSDQEAIKLAKRLRKLGFNAVRLHHMDTAPNTQTNPPRSLLTPGPYPTFNQTALTRLAHFMRVLSQEGLYVNLNLHVSYSFRASVDQVPTFENNAENATYGASAHVYFPRMITLQEQFTKELLRALNLRDFAGLAMVEINNESSLLAAWQRKEWMATVPPNYAPALEQLWQAWLIKHYGSQKKACDAWGECIAINGIIPLLNPTDESYRAENALRRLKTYITRQINTISNSNVGINDPGEIDDSAYAKRRYDFMRFLADTDQAYLQRLRTIIKQETNPLVPVAGTQMGYGGILNFDSHQQMDYIDEHFYIDHPDYPGTAWDRHDWRMRDTPLNQTEFNRLLALSFHRDSTKPFVISEYNYPFPNRHSAVIQPLMAAVAAAQDWDGLFFFDYMDGDNWADTPSNFTLSGDWGKFALTGQSALLFRQAQFPALTKRMSVSIPATTRVAIAASKDWGALASHLKVKHGITPDVANTAQLSIALNAPSHHAPEQNKPALPASKLVLNEQNLLILRTPFAKGVFGTLEKTPVMIDEGFSVNLLESKPSDVSVLISALDQQPLARSQHMLITVTGAVTGTQPGSLPARPKQVVNYQGQRQWFTFESDDLSSAKPSGARDVQGPVWIARTQLRFTVPLHQRQFTVYPLNVRGERLAPLAPEQIAIHAGSAMITLQANTAQTSLWYEVVANLPE
jgi:hypothetical protein